MFAKLKRLAGTRIVSDSAIYAFSTILERGTLVLASFFASLGLGASQFSNFGHFQIAATMIAGYSTLGMSALVAKLATEMKLGAQDNVHRIRMICIGVAVLSLLLSLLYLLAEMYIVAAGASMNGVVFVLCCMTFSLSVMMSSILLGLERYKQSLMMASAGFFAMMIGFLAAHGLATFDAYVVAYAAIYAILLAFGLKLASDILFHRPETGVRTPQLLSGLMRQAWPLVLASVLTSSTTWILSTVLLKTAGYADHSLFLIGLQWQAIATFIPSVLTRVVFPTMVKDAFEREGAATSTMRVPVRIGAVSAVVAALIAGVVWAGSGLLDILYAGKYPGVAHVVMAYVLCSVPLSLVNLFGNLLVADNRGRAWLSSCILGWTGAVITIWFASDLGAYAPAVATAVGYSLTILASVLLLRGAHRTGRTG